MTKSGFDIDELERLLADATPGEWVSEFDPMDDGDHATAVCLPGKAGAIGTFLAYCQHNWNEADYSERRISWKEATSNAALIVAARNSLPAILTEIRELRAENARLKKLTIPTWFYHPDYPEYCKFDPSEVIDEDYDPLPGDHVFEIDCAVALPSIWCAVHVSNDPDDDERFTYTEHASEAEARAALGEPQ